ILLLLIIFFYLYFFLMILLPPISTLFPTRRSSDLGNLKKALDASIDYVIAPTIDENFFRENPICGTPKVHIKNHGSSTIDSDVRSEEHTSELQSQSNLVCRLLLEKKKKKKQKKITN